jgi:hypothetical protein
MDKVNCTIPLAETQMEVFNGFLSGYGEVWTPTPAPVKVTMRLSPVQQVFIEIADMPVTLSGNLYNPGMISTLRLPSGPEIEVFTAQVLGMGDVNVSLLVPTRQPVTVIQTGENLHSVRFSVINFPSLYSGLHPALLQEEPWHVEIGPASEFREIKEVLSTESGYGLTHEGSIRRLDGKSFSAEEAHEFLAVLHLFLSFARGGSCGLTLIAGADKHGGQAWQQWGAYPTHPWFRLTSWLDHRHNNDDALSRVFPGLWRALRQTTGAPDDPVRAALYWYLRSNESNALQAATILTQAALERLARQLLPNRKYKALEGKSAAKKIRAVLRDTGIDPAIPQCCKELTALAQTESWCDGPETLTKTRNNLVHAAMRANVRPEAYFEARDLGQWYVELLLLKLFDYDGKYANRLTYNYEQHWTPENVPWA